MLKIFGLTTILIILFTVPVMAENKWEETDTVLILLCVADWAQTRDIATNRSDPCITFDQSGFTYNEINPILGRHPTLEQVDMYFLASISANILIIKYANPKIKKWWTIIGIATETYFVSHNVQIGVKFKI
jgi:hypothetical protein